MATLQICFPSSSSVIDCGLYLFFRFHQKGVPHPHGSIADNSWNNLCVPLLVSNKLFRLIISLLTHTLLYYSKSKILIPGF